jgi:inositol-1,3,4-trisphosphate 5/6-kinase/inositol-tetrakisphosphate 1-kinase
MTLGIVQVELSKPVEEQGPFDLIIHKITDLMVAADGGDEQAKTAVDRMETFAAAHPDIPVIDSLTDLQPLLDRSWCYQMMNEMKFKFRDTEVCSPPFVTLTDSQDLSRKLKKAGVTFPCVCKPVVAHGTKLAHQMALVFNESGFDSMKYPCVVQQFIEHNAVLYKIFVVGKFHYIVQRPSIKNLTTLDSKTTIFFDSHDVSKPSASSHLNEVDGRSSPQTPPDNRVITALARQVRTKMNLLLFGIDLIIETSTKKHYIIDINSFPGYEGVPNFLDALGDLLVDRLNGTFVAEQTSTLTAGTQHQHQKLQRSSRPSVGSSGLTVIGGESSD